MSFAFNWQAFAKQEVFQSHIHDMLTNALNKQKPRILEDQIRVVNLDWGTEAPTLEMLEIGDVATDRFRGVFKLNYTGGATVTVATKVQANPLNVFANGAPSSFIMPEFVAAPVSFPIPLHLTLRNIRLQGTVIVVFSKQGGLTLVFRNDPLQSIEVNSTFDKFATIASFLQQQIETQIRNLFREEVPSLLYQLSLKYLPSQNQVPLGLVSKPARADGEPVAFASIDSEKPVSLVNILHIGAMLQSRSTLALETPIMPTAIVRSELHHRASLLSQRQSHSLSMAANDQNAYDELYIHAKHSSLRSQRKPKRRTIKLRKRTETSTTPLAEPATETEKDLVEKSARTQLPKPVAKPDPVPRPDLVRAAEDVVSLVPPPVPVPAAPAVVETTKPAPHHARAASRSRRDTVVTEAPVKTRKSSGISRRLLLRPLVQDAKGLSAFSIRAPPHIIIPPAVLHPDFWAMPVVQDTDELPPPAYVA